MAADKCVNGTLDDAGYSSPVPVIGLYIAAATMVCFLFMFLDILAGFRNRKQWLPCRLFALNSITLTLLSIAAKIPVDLTTTMPTPQDQLSKLTGTSLICICMAFSMPSIGIRGMNECLANIAALSVFVLTVIVNICIQLSTGVIVLFKTEHIIMMCCLMLLLMQSWCFAYDINGRTKRSTGESKQFFINEKGSMLKKLKACHLHSYIFNPQLELSKDADYLLVCAFCIISLVVVVQATVRSLILKELELCDELSDYKWSVGLIIVTQIITILIGCFGISFRCFALFRFMGLDSVGIEWDIEDLVIIRNLDTFLTKNFKEFMIRCSIFGMNLVLTIIGLLVFLPIFLLRKVARHCTLCNNEQHRESEDIKEFQYLLRSVFEARSYEWILRKGLGDVKKLMDVNTGKKISGLVSRIRPLSHGNRILQSGLHDNYGIRQVSSLSVVILVRLATAAMPTDICRSWTDSLSEVFEVIHFVDEKMNSSRVKMYRKPELAKAVFESKNFAGLLPKFTNEKMPEDLSDLDKAVLIFKMARDYGQYYHFTGDELAEIAHCILRQKHGSIEELNNFMEQLFFDMLNEFLPHLPNLIYKKVIESRPEDFEEATRFSLKTLHGVQSLDGVIHWSYPVGVTCLINDPVPNEQFEYHEEVIEIE